MPTYDLECQTCNKHYSIKLPIKEFDNIKQSLKCDVCLPESSLRQVHYSVNTYVTVCNQATPDYDKHYI